MGDLCTLKTYKRGDQRVRNQKTHFESLKAAFLSSRNLNLPPQIYSIYSITGD